MYFYVYAIIKTIKTYRMEERDGFCLGFIEASVISTNILAAYLENSLTPWKHVIFPEIL